MFTAWIFIVMSIGVQVTLSIENIKCSLPNSAPANCSQETLNSTSPKLYYFNAVLQKCISFNSCNAHNDINTFHTKESCMVHCKAPSCTLPAAPTNGSYIHEYHNGFLYLLYRCNPKFKLTGSASRICMQNNTWDVAAPTCRAITCPNTASHFRISWSNCNRQDYRPGCMALITCPRNFRQIVHQPFRECLNDGTWSGVNPICARMYITVNGVEKSSITVNPRIQTSPLSLQCRMDPHFPDNAVIRWSRVPEGAIVKQSSSGSILYFPVFRQSHSGRYQCMMEINNSTNQKPITANPITINTYVKKCRTLAIAPRVLNLTRELLRIECIVYSTCSQDPIQWKANDIYIMNRRGVHVSQISKSRDFYESILTINNPYTWDGHYSFRCEARNNETVIRSSSKVINLQLQRPNNIGNISSKN